MKKVTLLLSFLLCVGMGAAQAQFQTLRKFADTGDGYEPMNALTKVGNKLYGMTYEGGVNYIGNIFSINTDGTGFTNLWSFSDTGTIGNTDGEYPYGNNLLNSGNKLFGMTYEGGFNGQGTIFSINLDGTHYKDLWDFNDSGSDGNANGAYPYSSLTMVGNKFFGMTYEGGSHNYGMIFSIDTDGSHFRDLWDFADTGSIGNTDGRYPFFNNLIVEGHKLYGFTYEGGYHNDGTAFSIDTNGTNYKDLWDFNYGNTNGVEPYSTPAFSNGKLFGTTYYGGYNDDGMIFSIDTSGNNYKDIYDFTGYGDGYDIAQSVIISGNMLYGMAYEGGANGYGTLFQIDTTGNNFTTLYNFDYSPHGGYPYGNDLIMSGGTLYGMTYEGGISDNGTIFKMDLCYQLQANQVVTDDTNNTCNGTATIVPSGGPTPYTYKWSNGKTSASVTGLCGGSYDCTVTDANGCSVREVVIIVNVTGVNNITADNGDVKLYPNPNNGTFTVDCNNLKKASTLSVYNAMGQAIYSSQLSANSSASAVDMSNAPAGVYFFRVVTQNGDLVKQGKIVIQK